jgi:hypothetical protein
MGLATNKHSPHQKKYYDLNIAIIYVPSSVIRFCTSIPNIISLFVIMKHLYILMSEWPGIQRLRCWRLGVSISRPFYSHRSRVCRCSTENFCYTSVRRAVLTAVQHAASFPVIKMYEIHCLSPKFFPTSKITAHRHRLVHNALFLPRPVLFNCSLFFRFDTECKYWLRLIHSSSCTYIWESTVTDCKQERGAFCGRIKRAAYHK